MTDRFRPASDGRKKSLWSRIVDLSLTDVSVLVRGIDADTIGEFERVLLEADFGLDATVDLIENLERAARSGSVQTEDELRHLLGDRIRLMLAVPDSRIRTGSPEQPFVVLLVGVNGTGKTTTAARLARRALDAGDTVLLAATDTFRPAAREQLRVWSDRLGTGFVGGTPRGDPAAVAFDAAEAAVARGIDRLIVDTAGRLHTQKGLMEELRKIDRVLGRVVPGAPHERLLVVDATTGQNVLNQAREFAAVLDLDGLVLAKFDSSGRGGMAVAVARELGLPVRYLGTGETADDLEPFNTNRYLEKLLA